MQSRHHCARQRPKRLRNAARGDVQELTFGCAALSNDKMPRDCHSVVGTEPGDSGFARCSLAVRPPRACLRDEETRGENSS